MRRVRLLSVTPNLDSSDWSRRAIWLDAATRIPRIVLQLLAANEGDSRGIKTTNAIIHGFFFSPSSSSSSHPRHAEEPLKTGRMSRRSKKNNSSCIQKLKDPPAFFFFQRFPPWFFYWALRDGCCHVDTRELQRFVCFDALQPNCRGGRLTRSFGFWNLKCIQLERA